jgi:hypothetical protein
MSFSSSVKEELSKLGNLANKKNVEKEFIGYLISKNITIQKGKIKFTTESEYNINRFAKLLNNMNLQEYKIEIKGKVYDIEFTLNETPKDISVENVEIANEEEAKALVRGLFLGSGYVSETTQKNHLEISLLKEENAKFIINLLKRYNINSKMIQKGNDYSIYIKDGEEISKFLAFIGANKSVLNFEEARVQKDMNNKINRIVNCESSNLNKTLNASIEQINAIKHLQETNRFDLLNDKLKEVALVRLENPNMSLEELGKKLSGTVGKSGVNYRLNKIIEIANK